MQNCVVKPRSASHNKHQLHFNRPWSSAGAQPVCYHRSGLSVWQNWSEAGTLNSALKFLQHIQNQQMRSTSPPFGEYGPFLFDKYVKSIFFFKLISVKKKKKPLYNCLALMERINIKKWKKAVSRLTVLSLSCTARTWTSMRRTEAHRRALLMRVLQTRKNMERKINTKKKKKKNIKRKAKKKLKSFFQEWGLWRAAAAARIDFTSVWS